jgi:chloramphenicol 3-O phosphotransferase
VAGVPPSGVPASGGDAAYRGRIVVLNGTSSAGKTTIAAAWQAATSEPWLQTGLDAFLQTVPPALKVVTEDVDPAPGPGWLMPFQDGRLVARPRLGPVALRMLDGMYRAAAATAEAGNDVMFDDVIYDPDVRVLAARALKGRPAWLVGLRCDVDVAVARELARGDRAPGGAALFAETVHSPPVYDLEIDTGELSPAESVQRIATMLAETEPTAFATLAL